LSGSVLSSQKELSLIGVRRYRVPTGVVKEGVGEAPTEIPPNLQL
jgi:hypothetical protein